MLNKVPEITLYSWVIKILCTTVGETFADDLDENLGLGLTHTSQVMSAAPIAGLVAPFRSRGCVPGGLLAGGGAGQRRRTLNGDRRSPEIAQGEELRARVFGQVRGSAEGRICGRVAYSPSAHDDIVEELKLREPREIIVETPPSHFSHRLHLDLLHRVGELGHPLRAVPASA